ncbi:MAG: PAS domain S-box protein [Opitutaceae bacterium]|jgi:PAS domain S-box-containing protein
MPPPDSAPSPETVANLAARLAVAERALDARDKTIQALVTREKDRTAKRSSAFGILEETAVLQQVVANKTLELEAKNRELRQSETALSTAQRMGQLGNWEFDLGTQKIFWSPEVYRIFEIDPKVSGASLEAILKLIHPDDREKVDVAYASGLKHHQSFESSHRLLMPDGRIKHVHELAEFHHDAASRTMRIIGTVQNITQRMQADLALRESEEKLRQIIEHSVQLFYSHTPDHVLTYVSQQAREFFDLESADALRRWTDFLTDNPVNAEGIALTERALKTGERQHPYELELITARGRKIWVEVHESPVVVSGKAVGMVGALTDITGRKQAELDLETLHKRLLDVSRQAGMAEVATGVLHNVGNVLNSVNVSATLVADQVRRSKVPNVGKLSDLLHQHRADLGGYLTTDPKGKIIPAYLVTLAAELSKEQATIIAELDSLHKNIGHIKDIVAMQQSYAKTSGVVETVSIPDLIEDALRMNAGSLARHDVDVAREYLARPVVTLEKNKALQILVNLVRNAKYACDESGRIDKLLTIRITADDHDVSIAVIDNGVGIPSGNLNQIFAHGFTTRKHGHGFGLHSGALAAKELGGSLTAHSDGPGLGATFILRLPSRQESLPPPEKPVFKNRGDALASTAA